MLECKKKYLPRMVLRFNRAVLIKRMNLEGIVHKTFLSWIKQAQSSYSYAFY